MQFLPSMRISFVLRTNNVKMIDAMIRPTEIFLTEFLPRAGPDVLKNLLADGLVTKEGVVFREKPEEVTSDSVMRTAKVKMLVNLLPLDIKRAIRECEYFVTEGSFEKIVVTNPIIKNALIIMVSKNFNK